MTNWIVENQFFLIIVFFIIGTVTAHRLFFARNQKKIWKIADLGWIIAGGLSAATAVILSVLLSEINSVRRESDIFTAAVASFNKDAKRFMQVYCTDRADWRFSPVFRENGTILCAHIRKIEAETAEDAKLVRFASIFSSGNEKEDTDHSWAKGIAFRDYDTDEMNTLFDALELANDLNFGEQVTIDTGAFSSLAFPVRKISEEEINQTLQILINSGDADAFCSEFITLNSRMKDIRFSTSQLQNRWNTVMRKQPLFLWRALALLVLSFIFPLRVGKSVHELKTS